MSDQNPNSILVLEPAAIAYYSIHSYEFVCDLILKRVWDKIRPSRQQRELLDAYDKYERVLCDSGHGSGKSSVLSWIGCHFLVTRPSPCRVPCTAPTGHQLKDVLWSNFSRWITTSLFTDDLGWMATEVRHKLLSHPHFAIARTSNKSDNMQGQHEEHMLWLIDEAYGILDSKLWDVINGSMTEDDNKMVLAGNPTQVTGYCADVKNPKRSPEWKEPKGKVLRFNSEESELVSKTWLEGMRAKWGPTHDVYRVRVLGLPPLGNPLAFIALADVAAAINREVEDIGKFEIAIDPAREGDDLCAMAVRRGFKYFPLKTLPKSDEIEIAAMAIREVREIREKYNYKHRIRIKIENIGGYGSGAIDILRRNKKDNIEVVAITSGGSGNEEYATGSSVMWAEFKNALQRLSLPDDDDLMGQLCAREGTIDLKSGRLMIEPKRRYKERMGHSPDRADAVIMCWATEVMKTRLIETDISNCTAVLNVKWGNLDYGTIPMVGLYTDKETKTGAVLALWKQETSTLFCVLSQDYDCARPEKIIPDLMIAMNKISAGAVKSIHNFEWFGNKPYDAIGLGTMRDIWSKNGINVRTNDVFNIDGAVLAINRMLQRKGIIIDETWAGQMAVDMQGWYAEEKDKISNSVLALASLVSVISDGTYISRQAPMPRFSKEREQAKTVLEEQYGRPGQGRNTPIADSDSWMA